MEGEVDNGLYGVLVWSWIGSGIIGVLVLLAKGKLKLGLVGWVLLGWWGLVFAVVLAGPLFLIAGLMMKADYHCPICKAVISRDALKCPHCQSVLTPPEAASPQAVNADEIQEPAPPDSQLANPMFQSGGQRPK
jgi:hypothetical protein